MKNVRKIMSVLLAALMMSAAFAVAVNAATSETPVGTADTGLTPDDFSDKDSSGQTISVKVNEVEHRYAVDLTFSFDDLTIDSDIVWNVKDMKYDVGETKLSDQDRKITVTNRSDMPVYAYATAQKGDADDGVSITTSNGKTNRLEVAKAAVGTGNTNGTSSSEELTVFLKSDNWQKVAEHYAAKSVANQTTTFVLTTVTVSLSKSAN